MEFSCVRSIALYLLLKILLVSAQSTFKIINLNGYYTCSLHPGNQLWLELRAWDVNGFATRLNAIDDLEVEILTCPISGDGTITSPFYMTSKIQMTNDAEVFNVCGMTKTTVNGRTVYNWRVKAYTYPITYFPNNIGVILSLQCDTGDLADGVVETLVDINVPDLTVTAADPADVTGPNSIATNANIIYTAQVYPNGRFVPDDLKDAVGIYCYNCYSANNAEMTDVELFINEIGCPVPGAAYAPTSGFRLVQNTTDHIQIQASFANAVLIDNENDIYITCMIGKCTAIDDPRCIDVCAANTNNVPPSSAVNTGIVFSTSFTVQDQLAHALRPTATDDSSVVLTSINSGGSIEIAAYNFPGGIGGSADLLDAKGFYVYNCRYATNAQMENPTQFVNNVGCRIQTTILTLSTNFATDDALTSEDSSRYVVTSGPVVVQNVGNQRIWARCDVGKCNVTGHNFCKTRCGATNNIPGGAVDLGYRGHTFTLSILDIVNVPALSITILAPNGEILTGTSAPVNVGEMINFGAEVTPGGAGVGGPAFVDAKGIFIHSCYALVNGVQTQILDEESCPVPDSPYRTSQPCRDVTDVDGVPPFKVDCGTITVPEEGDVSVTCGVMFCTTANNAMCEERCGAGEIGPGSNVVDPGVTTTSAFRAEIRDDRRTAVKSEELRTTIAAVCAVAAGLILLAVSIGTYCVVNKQKALAKSRMDPRTYNY